MSAIDVQVRQYKRTRLQGGALIVSIPHFGVGSLLVTDFLLQALSMDQVACLESDGFPPIAMLRQGKPRAPARIHADAKAKIAVARCEFNLPAHLAAPTAKALLTWAKQQKLQRVVALDGVVRAPGGDGAASEPEIRLVTTSNQLRADAKMAGVEELSRGVLGGVPAMLLLESRFVPAVEVGTLLATFDDAMQDARSSLMFASLLQRLLPRLKFNVKGLEANVAELDAEVRALQEGAEKALERLFKKSEQPPAMYG